MKRVTISDIAKDLNTTPATVSRALKDHPRISKETKTKIIAYAEEVGFQINKVASSLRSGKTHVIGVMIPSALINFFGSVVHGIESLANDAGYTILIYQTNEKREYEVKGLDTFLSARVDGILVSLSKDTKDYSHFEEVKKKGIPIAFFDRTNENIGISSIVVDDYKGGFLATEHLIKNGYKKIAHISGPLHIKGFHDRFLGYKDALAKYDIPYNPELLYSGDISIEAGICGINHFHKTKVEFDAIFAIEDFTALGALKQLKELNYRIPQDVGLIGFANEKFGEFVTPTMSSIDQQTVKMGKEAFKLIINLIEAKEKNNTLEEKKIILDPIPVFRASTNPKS